MERKTFSNVQIKSDGDLKVSAIISTETRDRGGDVLKADGMQIKGRVVVLMAHGTTGLGSEPVAKLISVGKVDLPGQKRGIKAVMEFYPDETGKRLAGKIKAGVLLNWSIGWMPIEYHYQNESDGTETRVVTIWELLELSPVGVPMNPEATTILGEKAMLFKFLKEGQRADGYTGKKPSKTVIVTRPLATKIEIPDALVKKVVRETVHNELNKMKGRVE